MILRMTMDTEAFSSEMVRAMPISFRETDIIIIICLMEKIQFKRSERLNATLLRLKWNLTSYFREELF